MFTSFICVVHVCLSVVLISVVDPREAHSLFQGTMGLYHQHSADVLENDISPLTFMKKQFPKRNTEEVWVSYLKEFGFSGKQMSTEIGTPRTHRSEILVNCAQTAAVGDPMDVVGLLFFLCSYVCYLIQVSGVLIDISLVVQCVHLVMLHEIEKSLLV